MGLNVFLLKEIQEMVALLEAICHEMQQGLCIMNPGPMTHQVIDSIEQVPTIIKIKKKGDYSFA
jgi:hypothetical protein